MRPAAQAERGENVERLASLVGAKSPRRDVAPQDLCDLGLRPGAAHAARRPTASASSEATR